MPVSRPWPQVQAAMAALTWQPVDTGWHMLYVHVSPATGQRSFLAEDLGSQAQQQQQQAGRGGAAAAAAAGKGGSGGAQQPAAGVGKRRSAGALAAG